MLKRRLIPKLQLKNQTIGKHSRLVLVTTHQFEDAMEIGDPVSQAKIYQAQMADELIFVDLDAADGLRKEFIDVLRKTAEQVFMPFTVGGGVKTIDDFRILLTNGADKVSINTAAFENPEFITKASDRYGSQCVVVSIDYRGEGKDSFVWIKGGKIKTDLSPLLWAIEAEKQGAGELLLTAIDRDGTSEGLDIELARTIVENVSIPVILSGGCGLASHFIDGFTVANAAAVAAGTFFCFKDQNPMQTRSHIRNANIQIRLQS